MVGVELPGIPARNLSVQLVKTSMSLGCFAMYNALTLHVQCIYMYIHCTWVPLIVSIYPYGINHCCLVCTALVIGMYYAIIQELVILCIEGSDTDRPSRNG